jgi:hypothetical protein
MMTPQRQTLFVDTNPNGTGNCQSAAMASILDLPLSDVIDTASLEMRARGFWDSIDHWLGGRGLKLEHFVSGDERLKGEYSIGSGPSPRGKFWHAVVCKNGVMVFDPHPSDDGLVSLERHDMIVEMTDVEKKMFALKAESK